jgi:hypothetical protein
LAGTTFVIEVTARRLMKVCKGNFLGCSYRLIWNAWKIPAICTVNLQAADMPVIFVF